MTFVYKLFYIKAILGLCKNGVIKNILSDRYIGFLSIYTDIEYVFD